MESEEEGVNEERDRYRETPRGEPVEVVRMGEDLPPPEEKWTSQTLTQIVRTCCCGKSMENSRITTMGRTWTGDLRTTTPVSVDGSG